MAFEFLSGINMCIKYLLFIFNLFFVITGIILIAVGAAVQSSYHEYQVFLDTPYISIPALLIATGVIVFIVAFFGCCGAIRESYIMTLIFSILLICVFILELSAGISGYALRGRTESIIKKNLLESIEKYYNGDNNVQKVWDGIQSSFDCCGIDDSSTWTEGLPVMCCKIPSGTLNNFTCISSNAYKDGCYDGMVKFVKSHAGSLGAAGICIAVAQLIGIVFACYLTRRAKYESTG